MPPWHDDGPAAAADDGDDDFLSASSGSRSESPSPRTASLSSSLGAFALSPRATFLAAAAAAVDGSGGQPPAFHQGNLPVKVAAEPSSDGLKSGTGSKWNGDNTVAVLPADVSAVNGSPVSVPSDIQPAAATASADAASIAETFTQQRSGDPVLPPQPAGEALLPPQGLAPLQAPSKKARRVTWAAGVVSPRPRDRQRWRRRRRWLGGSSQDPDAAVAAAGTVTGSFLLQCPPDDGELEGFGGARLARTGAAAMALWAHRASEVIVPLLLASLSTPLGGSHRFMRVPAEHPTMPGSHRGGFAADHGGPGSAGGGGHHNPAAAPGGNPLVLAAALGAVAAVVRLAWGNSIRTRVSEESRRLGTPRACATHAALACVGAVLLAVACHLAPPPYARTGSGLGVVEGVLAAAAAISFGLAAAAPDALQLGLQRDWLWELLPNAACTTEPWPREQDVAHGLAVCELGGALTGGLLLLLLGPVATAAVAAALHLAAWLAGAALLRRFRARAVPPGMASLASELGGSSIVEVEMSQSPNMLADEGDAQAAQHNGNGLALALLLSNGGGGQAAAASVTDPQQPPEGQQAPQQQDQAEQQAVSSAVSGSSVQLAAPTSVRGGCCALRAFWTDFQGWAEQPAAPAAAAAALMHASILNFGVLMLAFLAARGVPVVVLAAAAAADALAAAAGGTFAPALTARFGGLLPGGAVMAAAQAAAAWLATAPLLAENADGAHRRWTSDAAVVAALLCVAAARAAFGSTVQRLMERWQEGGDAGAVGGVQRRLRGGCAAFAAVGALALASPARVPWLMAASAACATAAATVFCAFAAVEWKYCSPGGGLVPLAGAQLSAEADAANIELESEYLIP